MPYDPRFPLAVCPVCGSATFSRLADGPTPAVRCDGCRLGIELSVSADPAVAYRSEVYDPNRDGQTGSTRWARFHHDCAVASERMRQLDRVLDGVPDDARAWVDVGANSGATAVVARRRGWRPRAVEACARDCELLELLHGIDAVPYGQWVACRAPAGAGVVSFFDVLEHLLDPTAAVAAAARDLAVGGVLVAEVPDLDRAADFRNWKHRRVGSEFTEHQYHFCEESLGELVGRHAPGLVRVHAGHPVEGKLQMAWRKSPPANGRGGGAPLTAAQLNAAAAAIAMDLLGLPGPDRRAFLARIREKDPAFARSVEGHMTRMADESKG